MNKRNAHKYDHVNLVGKRHERLEVIRKADHGITRWICKCDCGNVVELMASQFFNNKSCGCFERENRKMLRDRTRTHGMTETRLYGIWCGIKDRCYNPNIEHYDRYGGRGVEVCDEWKHSFESFRDWAIKSGFDETKTGKEQSLDRIDVNGNYEPDNCRWISMKQQARNRTDTVYIETSGGRIPAREFAEIHGITDYVFLFRKIKSGYSEKQILSDWEIKTKEYNSYLSVNEAVSLYGACEGTIRKWIKDGKLKAEKHGLKWYIPKGQEIGKRK